MPYRQCQYISGLYTTERGFFTAAVNMDNTRTVSLFYDLSDKNNSPALIMGHTGIQHNTCSI